MEAQECSIYLYFSSPPTIIGCVVFELEVYASTIPFYWTAVYYDRRKISKINSKKQH